MKVLCVNQYFWPDIAATAQLLSDLGEDLAARGCSVRAIAGRGRYASERAEGLPGRQRWRGVEIRRVRCTNYGRASTLRRVADYASFMMMAGVEVAFGGWNGRLGGWGPSVARDPLASAEPRDDRKGREPQDDGERGERGRIGRARPVVVCLSTPPLVAALGLLARLHGARFVYKVEDLYPDVAVALGMFRAGSVAARAFGWASALLLRRADAVVALDGAMQCALKARGARRVEVIPNWADGVSILPDQASGTKFRGANNLNGRFVVLYSGNLGLAHRFDAIIDAARVLAATRREVVFLFVGDGPRLAEVAAVAKGLPNVRFMPYQPRESLIELYNAADVHLVTLRDEVAGMLVPSKYAAALAAGKPVLLVGGEGADLWREIGEERLGWCCPHETSAVLAAIETAIQAPEAREACGRRAREVFELRYDRRIATARWGALLREVAEGEAMRAGS